MNPEVNPSTKKKHSKGTMLLGTLVFLSFPISVICAFVFDDIGGQILGGWFGLLTGFIAFGAFREFVVSSFRESVVVDGTVIQINVATKYVDSDSGSGIGRTTKEYFTPEFQYRFLGREYQVSSYISRDRVFHKLFGPKVGAAVKIRVPVNTPQKGELNSLRGRYIHLLIGLTLSGITAVIFYFVMP
ncbi:DUF3592 domain-containing protein [Enterovibrio norvegicus]|uniref:DUF3592 domain-containing protein n=1 Tax=Enterovibrio norvegicus TaxID=188144 RepID=UPI0024B20A2C|nr:DUF3592 domain-containing protein [Enterovibrio norvegicus]